MSRTGCGRLLIKVIFNRACLYYVEYIRKSVGMNASMRLMTDVTLSNLM